LRRKGSAAIGYDVVGKAVKSINVVDELSSEVGGCVGRVGRNEVRELGETVDYD